MARTRTNPETAATTDKPPIPPAQSPTANGGDVARRAYDLYLVRGCAGTPDSLGRVRSAGP
jgi:hypothetical protein